MPHSRGLFSADDVTIFYWWHQKYITRHNNWDARKWKKHKSDANTEDFENWLYLSSTPITLRLLTRVFCTSGPNLVALAWACDKLLWGQARNGVNFDFEVEFDLEGQSQSPPKAIGILTKVFYTCDPNLVILARIGYPLDKQVIATPTDRQTQGNGNTRWLNWPRVKTITISLDVDFIQGNIRHRPFKIKPHIYTYICVCVY